jgi:glycine/serine hydroxymethyltransferase
MMALDLPHGGYVSHGYQTTYISSIYIYISTYIYIYVNVFIHSYVFI